MSTTTPQFDFCPDTGTRLREALIGFADSEFIADSDLNNLLAELNLAPVITGVLATITVEVEVELSSNSTAVVTPEDIRGEIENQISLNFEAEMLYPRATSLTVEDSRVVGYRITEVAPASD